MSGVGELQTIDACLGIATAAIRLTQFFVRLKKAGEIGSQTISTAIHVSRLLKQVTESLRRRGSLPDHHALKAQDDAVIQRMHQTMGECERSLRTALVQVFGENAVKIPDFSEDSIRRANIAFHPEHLTILKSDLQLFLLILKNYELPLLLNDNIIARDDRKALQSTVETYLQHSMQSIVQYQGLVRQLSRLVIETTQVQTSSTQESRRESHVSGQIRNDSESQGTQAELPQTSSVALYDGLESSRGIVEQTLQRLTVGSSLPSDSHDDHVATSEGDVGNLSEGSGRPDWEQDKGFEGQPLSLLRANIETFRRKSYQAQVDGNWPEARRCLEALIKYSAAQAKRSDQAFEEELKFEHMLAVALVHLDCFTEALDRLDKVSPSLAPQDQQMVLTQRDDAIREAHLNQLRAYVMLDKFIKSQSKAPTQIPTKEIRDAKAPAMKAFGTYHEAMETGPTEHVKAQYPISAQLLAMIMQIIGEPEESENVLAEAKRLCGQEVEPVVGRRDSAMEDILANTLGEIDSGSFAPHMSDSRDDAGSGVSGDGTPSNPQSLKIIDGIKRGEEEDIIKFLEQYPHGRLSETDEEGSTALHYAAEMSTARLVGKLAEHSGSDVGQKNNDQDTALFIALKNGKLNNVKTLAAYEECVLSRSQGDWTVLHHAVDRQKTAAMTAVLESPHVDRLVRMQASGGMTALHYCVHNKRPEHAAILLKHCPQDVIDLKNAEGQTALDMALTASEMKPAFIEIIDLILDEHAGATVAQARKEALDDHKRRRSRGSTSSDRRLFGSDDLSPVSSVSTSDDTGRRSLFPSRRRSSNRTS